jgi:hypothetical protein
LARLGVERQFPAFNRLGAGEELLDGIGVERLEHQDPRPREQRRDQLEGWILRGGADQHDGAVFHDR